MRTFGITALLACAVISAPASSMQQAVDTDRDGISDTVEQTLLEQFRPRLLTGRNDCSNRPAAFQPDQVTPGVLREDGTIYGQVFPARTSTAASPLVEIHFYHLWRRDCGEHPHPLDAEHVAVLVKPSSSNLSDSSWKAIYWYAAAHENTVCDVSQITRASTIQAEDHGATIWVSPGKHASYLNSMLCRRGCGADRCEQMAELAPGAVINLGEPNHPMNGSTFIASPLWPLLGKMSETNFPANPLARLEALPATDIAWFNAGRHPAQQIIAISASTESALAGSGSDTVQALGSAQSHTGNALLKSFGKTAHALGASAHRVGRAIGVVPTSPTAPRSQADPASSPSPAGQPPR